MNRYSSWLVVLLLCTATLLACNSNSGGGGDNSGSVTPFGTGGTIGTTGTGGTIDVSGSGGSGSMTTQVVCGAAFCPDPVSALPAQIAKLLTPGQLPVACCDMATATCGIATASGGCVPAPPADPRCPDTISGAVNAPTCCAGSTNQCGYYISASMPCTIFNIPSLAHGACAAAMGTGGTTAAGTGGMSAMDADGGT